MTSSMTGFARRETGQYYWEIRSVNHRGLDVRLKIPEEIRTLEPKIIGEIKDVISRGSIEVSFKRITSHQHSHHSDPVLPEALRTKIEKLDKELPSNNRVIIDVTSLLRDPSVLLALDQSEEIDLDHAFNIFKLCLYQLVEYRRKEGSALVDTIKENLKQCKELVRSLKAYGSDQPKEIQRLLEERLAVLEARVEPGRLAQEVAMLAQKADFTEELNRLRLHLRETKSSLNHFEPNGRRLVFLAQELVRESNTLSAKIQSKECADLVVDLKVQIDQIREQVQNIE